MSRATLVRTRVTIPHADILFEGDLAGAIAAARAVPADQRAFLRIETDDHFYGPEHFDMMTPDHVPLADYNLHEGAGIVRLEKGALELLRGDRRMMPPASIVNDQVDVITAILRHKKTVQDVEEVDGKRLIRITAADLDA